jgi:hypothetical protein
VVCNPTTAGNFTWVFLSSETQLQMSSGIYPAGSGLFTITALTETSHLRPLIRKGICLQSAPFCPPQKPWEKCG